MTRSMVRPAGNGDDYEIKSFTAGDPVEYTQVIGRPYETTDPETGEQVGIAEHIVAVTGVVDEVGDVIVPGAFRRTMREIKAKGVTGHDWKIRVSKALDRQEWLPGDPRIAERIIPNLPEGKEWPAEAGALYVKAQYNLATPAGREAYENAKFYGNEENYSIGYKVTPGGAFKKNGIRYIKDLDWFEWSDVLHGANKWAQLLSVKSDSSLLDSMERTGLKQLPADLENTSLAGDEEKVRYVRNAHYWGLPYGTPIRPGMKPRGPVAQKLQAEGRPVREDVGLVDIDPSKPGKRAPSFAVKPTARGKHKRDDDLFERQVVDLFHEDTHAYEEADGEDAFQIIDEEAINKGEPYNPLDLLIENGVKPVDLEDYLHQARDDGDFVSAGRLGLDADENEARRGEIDSFISDVMSRYREKYNAALTKQNDDGNDDVAPLADGESSAFIAAAANRPSAAAAVAAVRAALQKDPQDGTAAVAFEAKPGDRVLVPDANGNLQEHHIDAGKRRDGSIRTTTKGVAIHPDSPVAIFPGDPNRKRQPHEVGGELRKPAAKPTPAAAAPAAKPVPDDLRIGLEAIRTRDEQTLREVLDGFGVDDSRGAARAIATDQVPESAAEKWLRSVADASDKGRPLPSLPDTVASRDTAGHTDAVPNRHEGSGPDGQDRRDGGAALAGAPADSVRADQGQGDVLPGAGGRGGAGDRRDGGVPGGDGPAGRDVSGEGRTAPDGTTRRGEHGAAGDGAAAAGAGEPDGAGAGDRGTADTGGRGSRSRAGRVRGSEGRTDGAAAADAGAPDAGVTEADQPQPDQADQAAIDAIPEGGPRFRPTGINDLAPAGKRAKLNANMAALRLVRKLQDEKRSATPAEQKVLAKWAGWGGLPEAFDETKKVFAAEREELKKLLPTDELNAAKRNTLNAHYTDARAVQAIWDAVEKLGFDGGRVLEPGSGSGTFIGFSPDNADMVGVEVDPTTAAISKYLYPDAKIRTESFGKTKAPRGAFDMTVGNVPFGDFPVHDTEFNKDNKLSIHNHFIIKSLALTRPGGLVAVLTSRYTLDAEGKQARQQMAEMGDLVGAVRLPTGAHQRVAETPVIEDLLIFRRRADGESPQADQSWINSTRQNINGFDIAVNDYFTQHPENVLGEVTAEKGQYGTGSLIVNGDKDMADLPAVLDGVVAHAQAEGLTATPREGGPAPELIDVDGALTRHEGHIQVESDGTFTQAVGGAAVPFKVPVSQAAELRDLVGMRDALSKLLTAESATAADTPQIAALRADLNARYDAYVAKPNSGPINRYTLNKNGSRNTPGQGGFRRDPMSAIVRALETYDATTGTATKADIFRKRSVAPREIATTADNPADALTLSMDTYGEIRLDAIGDMLGVDAAEARRQLGTLVFDRPTLSDAQYQAAIRVDRANRIGDDPDSADLALLADVTGGESATLEPAAAYLSGNVRQKLAAARALAQVDARYQANVDALEKVVPRELTPEEIDGRLGAAWIGTADVKAFLHDILDTEWGISVSGSGGGIWTVETPKYGNLATEVWGTPERNTGEIVQALLEQRSIKVTNTVDGRSIPNLEATLAAQAKAEEIQERFAEWLWEDPARARRLQTRYNDQFNAIALRSYDGAKRTFPGMAQHFEPREHQVAAVERIVNEPTALLGHVVGAGKTAEMTMGTAELKRLGLARKPAIVIPNHMLEQFSREYLEIYPNAKILAAGTKDLEGDKRREFVARAATGDWDAVILTQTAFESIPMSPEQIKAYIDRELADMRAQLVEAQQAAAGGGEDTAKKTVKKMEKAILRAEEALNKKLSKTKDSGVSFEQTGIDYLMVDEAHGYSNLRTLSNIQGAGAVGSDRATDLHMKLEYLRENNASGRVATFATGTPIRNTVTQAYVMQKFLRPDLLKEAGIYSFDQWAATFGQVVEEMELKPEGTGFRQTSRFAKFRNVPELLRLFHVFADIKLAEDLKLPTPTLRGGKVETVTVAPSDALMNYIRDLGERAERVRSRGVEPEDDNMLKISTDGRKAALSMELVGQDHEPGKIEAAADRIAGIWQQNKDKKYLIDPKDASAGYDPTPGGLQIVFMDMGTPTSEGWNGYDALKQQLAQRGMDPSQVRFIHEAKNDAQKAEMFAAARSGKISVLIGSSEKMGVGTNVQNRAIALHHLDAPWRPADVEQRDGRIMRQGNQHKEMGEDIQILRYVTEGSFDAYMWQTLERKAKFINQIMKGSLDVREIEDIGDTAMSYAEVKALATGNPDLLSKAKIDTILTKLERLNRTHTRTQSNLGKDVVTFAAGAEQADADATQMDAAIAKRTNTRGDAFAMSVDGSVHTARGDAAEALRSAMSRAVYDLRYAYGKDKTKVLGAIGGHTLRGEFVYTNTGPGIVLRFDGVPGDIGTFTTMDLSGNGVGIVQRVENNLAGFEQRRQALLDRADYLRTEVERMRPRIGKEFPQTAMLEAARKKSARLREKMQRDSRRAENPNWKEDPNLAFDPTIDTDQFDDPILGRDEAVTVPEPAPEALPAISPEEMAAAADLGAPVDQIITPDEANAADALSAAPEAYVPTGDMSVAEALTPDQLDVEVAAATAELRDLGAKRVPRNSARYHDAKMKVDVFSTEKRKREQQAQRDAATPVVPETATTAPDTTTAPAPATTPEASAPTAPATPAAPQADPAGARNLPDAELNNRVTEAVQESGRLRQDPATRPDDPRLAAADKTVDDLTAEQARREDMQDLPVAAMPDGELDAAITQEQAKADDLAGQGLAGSDEHVAATRREAQAKAERAKRLQRGAPAPDVATPAAAPANALDPADAAAARERARARRDAVRQQNTTPAAPSAPAVDTAPTAPSTPDSAGTGSGKTTVDGPQAPDVQTPAPADVTPATEPAPAPAMPEAPAVPPVDVTPNVPDTAPAPAAADDAPRPDTLDLPDGRQLTRDQLDDQETEYLTDRWTLRDGSRVAATVERDVDGDYSWTTYPPDGQSQTGYGARDPQQAIDRLSEQLGALPVDTSADATPAPSPDEVITPDEVGAARDVAADAEGLIEAEDGELEVSPDVAERQDRVEVLLTQHEAGQLDLTAQSDEELGGTRRDVASELRLQEEIARRDRQRKTTPATTDEPQAGEPTMSETPTPTAPEDTTPADTAAPEAPAEPTGPKPRPGVAGAAEDLADALDDGDQTRVDTARARLESSVRRSRAGSAALEELRQMLDGGGDLSAEDLRRIAEQMRADAKEKRNAGARSRRLAKRLERERLRSLLGEIDTEMRGRNLDPEQFGGNVDAPGRDDVIPAGEVAAAQQAGAPNDVISPEELAQAQELAIAENTARDAGDNPDEGGQVVGVPDTTPVDPNSPTGGAPVPADGPVTVQQREPNNLRTPGSGFQIPPDPNAAPAAQAAPVDAAPAAPDAEVDPADLPDTPHNRMRQARSGDRFTAQREDGTPFTFDVLGAPQEMAAASGPERVVSLDVRSNTLGEGMLRIGGDSNLMFIPDSSGREVRLTADSLTSVDATATPADGPKPGAFTGGLSGGSQVVKGDNYTGGYFQAAPGDWRWSTRLYAADGAGEAIDSNGGTADSEEEAQRQIRDAIESAYANAPGYNRRMPEGETLPDAPPRPAPTSAPSVVGVDTASAPRNAGPVNPVTGQPDYTEAPLMSEKAIPTQFASGDIDAIQGHMTQRHRDTGKGLDPSTIQWDTAILAPGGGLVAYKTTGYTGYIIASTQAGATVPMPITLDKAAAMSAMDVLTRGVMPNGQQIDWSSPETFAQQIRSAFPNLLRVGDGLQNWAMSKVIADKIAAGQASGAVVRNSVSHFYQHTRADEQTFPNYRHNDLQVTRYMGNLNQLLHNGKRDTGKFTSDRRTAAQIKDDAATIKDAQGAQTVYSLGAPDKAVAMIERRVDELRASYGTGQDGADSRGAIILGSIARAMRDAYDPVPHSEEALRVLQPGDRFIVSDPRATGWRRTFRVVRNVSTANYNNDRRLTLQEEGGTSTGEVDMTVTGSYGAVLLEGGHERYRGIAVLNDGEAPPEGEQAVRDRIDQRTTMPAFDDAVIAARRRLESAQGAVAAKPARAPRAPRAAGTARARKAPPLDTSNVLAPDLAARLLDQQAQLTKLRVGDDVRLIPEAPKAPTADLGAAELAWEKIMENGGVIKIDDAFWQTAQLSPGGWFVTGKDGSVRLASGGQLMGQNMPDQGSANRYASYLERGVNPQTGMVWDWSDPHKVVADMKQVATDAAKGDRYRVAQYLPAGVLRRAALIDEAAQRGPGASVGKLLGEMPYTDQGDRPAGLARPSVDVDPYDAAVGISFVDSVSKGSFPDKASEKNARDLQRILTWARTLGPVRPHDVLATLRALGEQNRGKQITHNQQEYQGGRKGTTQQVTSDMGEVLHKVAGLFEKRADPDQRTEYEKLTGAGNRGTLQVGNPDVSAQEVASGVGNKSNADYAKRIAEAIKANGVKLEYVDGYTESREPGRPRIEPHWRLSVPGVAGAGDNRDDTNGDLVIEKRGRYDHGVTLSSEGSLVAQWRTVSPYADGTDLGETIMTLRFNNGDWTFVEETLGSDQNAA